MAREGTKKALEANWSSMGMTELGETVPFEDLWHKRRCSVILWHARICELGIVHLGLHVIQCMVEDQVHQSAHANDC